MFQNLLNQIQLPDEMKQTPIFQSGQIKKVEVHTESQRWTFILDFAQILPASTWQIFQQHLQTAFAGVKQVDFEVQVANPSVNSELLTAYWPLVVERQNFNLAMKRTLAQQSRLELQNQQLNLIINNDILRDYLSQQYLNDLTQTLQQMGFPSFKLQVAVDQSQTKMQQEQLQQKQLQQQQQISVNVSHKKSSHPQTSSSGPIIGKKIAADAIVVSMEAITEEQQSVVVEGYIFSSEVRSLRSGRQLLILEITDYTSSFVVKKFSKNGETAEVFDDFAKGTWLKVRGSVQEDNYTRELTINAYDLNVVKKRMREDQAQDKRIELHTHTNMSQMDAISSTTDLVKRAADWGQPAIAITDHSTAQSFPDAYAAGQKYSVKVIYGVEANLVDEGEPIAYNLRDENLADAEYVVFDVETTGLSAVYDSIIELAAVKMKDGKIIQEFDEFIDPGHPLSATTINLTSITDDMVHNSNTEQEAMDKFNDFMGGAILAGHNVTFDIGFLNAARRRCQYQPVSVPVVDTLEMSRTLHSEYRNHKLDSLAKRYDIKLEHHHRANSDAATTGYLMYALFKEMNERFSITNVLQLNDHIGGDEAYKQARPYHAILLAQTQAGLKNLFKIISSSMTEYYFRTPRVPRRILNQYRNGILVGSACSSGEVFTAMMQKGYDEAYQKAQFYDYLEIMPHAIYQPLIESGLINNQTALEEIVANIVKLGQDLDKPVVASGDVHYLDAKDAIYREIIVKAVKSNPLARQTLPLADFKTTDEMLADLQFLGEQTAHQVVIDNPRIVADWVDDDITPVKDKLYTPKIPGSEQEIQDLTYNKAHELYGDPLPEIVQQRLDKELKSIIGNGFSVIYLIAQKLVYKSNKDGYLVGSRGSVGSSLVATMTGITEVNPLPPHYRCPNCQYTEFYTQGEVGSGFDLADRLCPECQTELMKDGHDIPFETFLGFNGDKVPDIDLNFSGDYQPIAHNYTKVLFGEDHVFRAGTIGTVADRTAYGYVSNFEELTDQKFRGAEKDRLAAGSTGVKRTTGQHPAGIIVVPDYMDIYDFTPIQYPADDQSAAWKTTHFDFHSIHDNILKLDILGHDDPTMIRMLQDLSGIDPKTIPTDDPDVMSLFSGTEALGVTPEQINSKMGTLGVPEFGTKFVRGMLEETHPTTFAELLQISGLSHGTDVWLGNAEEYIQQGIVTLKDVIGCRDNIMMDLIHWGMEPGMSFQIMEHVRKGKGIPDEWQKVMQDNENVPDWYIDSCLKIKYMFPKAHATAYIMMALRIAYFKVHMPIIYYCAYLSVRADVFDLVTMANGKEAVKNEIKLINEQGNDATAKDKSLLTVLEIVNECLERDINIKMVDLEHSDAMNFKILDAHTLLAPFIAVPSLGLNVAKQIVAAREEQPFLSKEDLSKRGHVSQSIIDYLTENKVLEGIPDENQLSLF
ncbi:PolC-type DNA polymerase III [Bombilactobacillus folatiphilus]|uniref:DNA polymerase III PolC-type n=2 Tax=Bombilactobacillus folatiphilus TaxID=2923362 RepID=A0ABY4PB91_9LACO|nr:PolC-type DNA polymerase III [Bombilactobacillus folatiphilus]UQS82904.1 PolC-type DNA polymerase III [Bombilactobacillus folatiphilus]